VVSFIKASHFGEYGPTLNSELQRIGAPILRIGLTLNKPARFQLVDDANQSAGMQSQRGRQFLLTDSGAPAEQSKHADIGRSEPQWRNSLCEARRGMRSDLGE
jgi:hypothetical protein